MVEEEEGAVLLDAIRKGDRLRVQGLLAGNAALADMQAASGESAVLLAVYHGQDAIALDLVGAGASTTLHESAAVGLTDRVRGQLQSQPSELDAFSFDGWTPLHLAAFFGRTDTVRVLLEAGARHDLLARNAQANLPLHAATAGRRVEIVELLLAAGADVNAPTARGWTALHLAAHGGYLELVEIFLGRGARTDVRSAEGKTPRDLALEQGQQETARRLHQASAGG